MTQNHKPKKKKRVLFLMVAEFTVDLKVLEFTLGINMTLESL